MRGLNTTYNVCPGCGAGVGARADSCALCDTPLPRAGRRSAGQRTPQAPDALPPAQQQLWRELAMALSPSIRIVGYLAEGGMGSVFLGYDVSLKREVAIKVLAPELAEDEKARERFKREAEAAGGVSHPNVVAVHQVGELPSSRVPYFVMQYLDGPTLQHAVAQNRVLPESKVRRILSDVAAGLAAAHRRGVVHRDIKPTNVVLDAETGRALVLDFGIAAALDVRRSSGSMRLTTEGMYIGTPMYMSPEQAGTGAVIDRSDIYSLGVVAFELLTGRPPFDSRNAVALMASHLRDPAPRVDSLRADVSAELATLLARCLAKNPAERPSAQALVDFLDPDATSTVAWPPPGLETGRGLGARFVLILAVMGATLLLLFVLLHAWPAAGTAQWEGGDRPLVGLSAMLVFVLVGLAIGTGARVARVVSRGRSAGYPWAIVIEVLADRWRDTEALLNGRGAYALSDSVMRGRFMALRRARSLLFAAAALLALVAPVAWLFGALPSGGPGALLVTRVELIVMAVPPLLLLVVAALCKIPEARWRRRNVSATPSGPLAPVVREDLVRSWLKAARRGVHAPSRAAHRPVILGGVLLLTGAVMATVALAILSVLMSSTLRVQSRPATAALLAQLGTEVVTSTPAGGDAERGRSASGVPAIFADPGSAAGRRLMTSSLLSPSERAELPRQIGAGLCMNARELLFGADPRRIALVRSVALPQDGGAPGATVARSAQATEEWLTDPAGARANRAPSAGAERRALLSRASGRVLGLLGLSGLRERIEYCAAFLRA